jgi:hypothetical protein
LDKLVSADARKFGIHVKGLLVFGKPERRDAFARTAANLFKWPLLKLKLDVPASPEAVALDLKIADASKPCVLYVDMNSRLLIEGGVDGSRALVAFLNWMPEKDAQVFVVFGVDGPSFTPYELTKYGRFDRILWVGDSVSFWNRGDLECPKN